MDFGGSKMIPYVVALFAVVFVLIFGGEVRSDDYRKDALLLRSTEYCAATTEPPAPSDAMREAFTNDQRTWAHLILWLNAFVQQRRERCKDA